MHANSGLLFDFLLEWHTFDMYGSPHLIHPNSSEYSFAIANKSYDVLVSQH